MYVMFGDCQVVYLYTIGVHNGVRTKDAATHFRISVNKMQHFAL